MRHSSHIHKSVKVKAYSKHAWASVSFQFKALKSRTVFPLNCNISLIICAAASANIIHASGSCDCQRPDWLNYKYTEISSSAYVPASTDSKISSLWFFELMLFNGHDAFPWTNHNCAQKLAFFKTPQTRKCRYVQHFKALLQCN